MLEDYTLISKATDDFAPVVVAHFSAQADDRYSLGNPHAYLDSNIISTLNVTDVAHGVES